MQFRRRREPSQSESYFSNAKPSYKFDKKIYVDQWAFGLNAEDEVAGLLRNALSSPDDFD